MVGDSGELARRLAGVARALMSEGSSELTLDRIVRLAVEMVPACTEAGVSLTTSTAISTPAATSDLVTDSAAVQYECGEGPSMDALREQQVVRIDDLGGEFERWPRYAPRAAALGVNSILAFQLFTDEGALGVLSLYSRRPHAFTEADAEVGWIFASHAAIALAAAQQVADLRTALGTRSEIGEAAGILMERHHLTADDAFTTLARVSHEQDIGLRELARRITGRGDLA